MLAASRDPHFDGTTVQSEHEYHNDFTEDDMPDWEVAQAEVNRAKSQLAKEQAGPAAKELLLARIRVRARREMARRKWAWADVRWALSGGSGGTQQQQQHAAAPGSGRCGADARLHTARALLRALLWVVGTHTCGEVIDAELWYRCASLKRFLTVIL